jgi:hypothetical protein
MSELRRHYSVIRQDCLDDSCGELQKWLKPSVLHPTGRLVQDRLNGITHTAARHSDISTTSDIYVHVDEKLLSEGPEGRGSGVRGQGSGVGGQGSGIRAVQVCAGLRCGKSLTHSSPLTLRPPGPPGPCSAPRPPTPGPCPLPLTGAQSEDRV